MRRFVKTWLVICSLLTAASSQVQPKQQPESSVQSSPCATGASIECRERFAGQAHSDPTCPQGMTRIATTYGSYCGSEPTAAAAVVDRPSDVPCPEGTVRCATTYGSFCGRSCGQSNSQAATPASTLNVSGTSTGAQGGWIMVRNNDVMSGKHGVNFGLRATNGTVLKIQCREGKKVDFIVSTSKVVENLPSNKYAILEALQEANRARGAASGPFVPEHQRVVKTKIDGKKPQLEQWEIGQETGDLFATGAKNHLKEILKAQVFYFQFKPYGENQTTLEFRVAGLDSYKAALKENCGVD
jgi:hypothetical protein